MIKFILYSLKNKELYASVLFFDLNERFKKLDENDPLIGVNHIYEMVYREYEFIWSISIALLSCKRPAW